MFNVKTRPDIVQMFIRWDFVNYIDTNKNVVNHVKSNEIIKNIFIFILFFGLLFKEQFKYACVCIRRLGCKHYIYIKKK